MNRHQDRQEEQTKMPTRRRRSRSDSDLRITFIHPDGRTQKSEIGDCQLVSDKYAYAKKETVPNWALDNGVDAVIAAVDGTVKDAFTIRTITQDDDAYLIRGI